MVVGDDGKALASISALPPLAVRIVNREWAGRPARIDSVGPSASTSTGVPLSWNGPKAAVHSAGEHPARVLERAAEQRCRGLVVEHDAGLGVEQEGRRGEVGEQVASQDQLQRLLGLGGLRALHLLARHSSTVCA